jgi:hypothetical protein
MRYTITEGPNKDKRINIPDEFIEKNMRNLDLTRDEAVEMYLSDEGYMENEIVVAMTEKAKAAGTTVKNTATDRKKRSAPVRKPDEIKRALIASIASDLEIELEMQNAELGVEHIPVAITNIERMIAFTFAGDNYEITLTKKRKAKE